MKKSRFSESQTVAILNEGEVGNDAGPKHLARVSALCSWQEKTRSRRAQFRRMVEAAGIEPASTSGPQTVLHA